MIKELKIKKYTNNLEQEWDIFVQQQSRNGNIFHEQKFLSYHKDRFYDCSILVMEKDSNDIVAVVPAAIKKTESEIGIVSHPGSSYGGIIFSNQIKLQVMEKILYIVLKYYCKEYKADYFKLIIQEEFHTGKSFDELIFLLWHRGFKLSSKEVSSVKDLSDISLDNYGKTIKQYIKSKKDQKIGIVHDFVSETFDLKVYYDLIYNTLKTKYNKIPVHSYEELLELKKLYNDKVHIFFSAYQNNVIAALVVFVLNKDVVHLFYTAQDYEYANIKPLFGLFDFVFDFYRKKNFKYFNFGISSRGQDIKWGILDFKSQFGTTILTRDSWVLENLSGEWSSDGE